MDFSFQEKTDRLPKFVKNKYFIAGAAFVIWISFFDQNSLLDRFKSRIHLRELEEEKAYYKEKIKIENKQLEQLQTDKDNLERFAREQYLMKKDNEDIFIILDEE